MKNKQAITRVAIYGVDGLVNYISIDSICEKIATYFESILPSINIEDLSEWGLALFVNMTCTDLIAVGKKFLQRSKDRECEIRVNIPIPDNVQAPYGMPTEEGKGIGFFHSVISDSNHLLDPEYDKYANLEQYILMSAIKAIDLGFSKGFPCDGKEIKFSRPINTSRLIPPHEKHAIKYKQLMAYIVIDVPGFDNFVSINSIDKKINTYLESISPRIEIKALSGFRLLFIINSFCMNLIAIYKKLVWDPEEKEYKISIAIPLPDNTQASYGMPPGEDGKIDSFRTVESDHFYPLAPEYDKYDNLEQYIIETAIKAIEFGFTKGFAREGKELKFQDL